jgi:hypothetical protein
MNTPIRTHTYWMNIKEYKKWSKTNFLNKNKDDNVVTRTHIIFID